MLAKWHATVDEDGRYTFAVMLSEDMPSCEEVSRNWPPLPGDTAPKSWQNAETTNSPTFVSSVAMAFAHVARLQIRVQLNEILRSPPATRSRTMALDRCARADSAR